jgi:transposase
MEMWREMRRRVLVDGESKRSICEKYGLHFRTLQKILANSEPPGYRLKGPRPKRKIGPYISIIEEILRTDKEQKVKKKQRHTAKRIFDRLRDEHGYEGGYTAVKEAVLAIKERSAEVFVPLSHPAGWAQVDFGEAEIDLAGVRTKAHLFVMTLPFSDAFFVCAFPRECTQARVRVFRRGPVSDQLRQLEDRGGRHWKGSETEVDRRFSSASEPLPFCRAFLPGAAPQREGSCGDAGRLFPAQFHGSHSESGPLRGPQRTS